MTTHLLYNCYSCLFPIHPAQQQKIDVKFAMYNAQVFYSGYSHVETRDMSCFQNGSSGTDSKLYFWDIETDSLSYFNFDTGKGEQDDYPPEQMLGMQTGSAIEMSDADR